jgi:valyl-tRNA synthetase
MDTLMGIVRAVRNIRAEFNVPHGTEVESIIISRNVIDDKYLRSLAKVGKVTIVSELKEKPERSASAVVEKAEVYVLLAGLIDIEKEKTRLTKDKKKLEFELNKIKTRLGDQNFLTRANPESVAKEKEKEVEFSSKIMVIQERLVSLA